MNRKMKRIAISLLIALCFIIPTGAVIADKPENPKAGVFDTDVGQTPTGVVKDPLDAIRVKRIEDANLPVILQATTTEILGFYLEECDGNDMYHVVDDAIIPLEDCYEPFFKLQTFENGSHYEPEIEIYLMNANEEFCVYDTSFEDNARNYLEWGQIDLDCTAPGGYYDGWTWSDARSCGSDHSFKCTMYDEYKNMQHDILFLKDCIDLTAEEIELCDGTMHEFDNIGLVNLSFDIFVDGEDNDPDNHEWCGDEMSPLDYVRVGLIDGGVYDPLDRYYSCLLPGYPGFMNSDCTLMDGGYIFSDTSKGLWSVEFRYDYTPIAKKIDGCPGWWRVHALIDVDDLQDPTCFAPYFEWISDKERVFEGAYIDNVKINVIENYGEKIYQGHSQDWEDSDEGINWFEFPLDWDDDLQITVDYGSKYDDCEGDYLVEDLDPTYYHAICKIKDDTGGYNDIYEVDFEIGPYVDCEIYELVIEDDFNHEPIPDGGPMQYPSDAHIMFCYRNNGNDVMENVPITASGYKLVKETLFFDDFEGMGQWNYFYDGYDVYISDDVPGGAWSGNKALAMNDPDTMQIIPATRTPWYGCYSNDFFSMEDVTEARMDFYLKAVLPEGAEFRIMPVGYHYVIPALIYASGPLCQKEWIGPMQPQCSYANIDFKGFFDWMVGNGYMLDENGHPTYEVGIGFALFTDECSQDELWPADCFENGEPAWSGVYIDDVSIVATKLGEKVWEDTMVIPGPCQPGESCCDQFTWEDVPYSNYRIIVETGCDGDISLSYPHPQSNNWMASDILVVEDLEQASKVEGVDYTDCDPESWCISNVVGNDCGNDGEGDHYALATNCDVTTIPELVNDYIALEYINVSHLDLSGTLPWAPSQYCQVATEYIDYTGYGWNSDSWSDTMVVDRFEGLTGPIDTVRLWGLETYGDYDFATPGDESVFRIVFFEDNGGTAGTIVFDELITVDPAGVSTWYTSGTQNWQQVDLSLPTEVDLPSGFIGIQLYDSYEEVLLLDSWDGDDNFEFWVSDAYYQQVDSSNSAPLRPNVAFCVFDNEDGGGKAIECDMPFFCDFETWDYVNYIPLPFVSNSGWLDSQYPITPRPYSGTHWGYSWTAGDTLTTPVITFGNVSTTLSFWYCAESAAHPMDLQVEVDGVPIWSHLGYTHTSYQQAVIDLGNDGLDHEISIVGLTSDFQGQLLEDVMVERCYSTGEPPAPEGDKIVLDMTYQCDIPDWYSNAGVEGHIAGVILEIAGYQSVEGEMCDGCEDDDACPSGVSKWTQIHEFNGNAPGICQNFSVDLADYLDVNDTHMCLRFRLDTTDMIKFRSEYAWDAWYDLPGIGFHLHEISISNITYDEITGVGDFYEDFEDNNLINEDADIVWDIGCVTYGEHVSDCDDFKFCIAGGCPYFVPYECNTFTLTGTDSYGDGWDADYPNSPPEEAFVDVWVNGVLVVDDFTVPIGYGSWTTTFTACAGDEIEAEYYEVGYHPYSGEHNWNIKDSYGTVWLQHTGAQETQSVILPTGATEIEYFPAEPIDEALVWSTEIADAYEAYLFGNWEYNIPAGCTLTFEVSADGGDNWMIIAKEEGPSASAMIPIPCTNGLATWISTGTIDEYGYDLTPFVGGSILVRVHVVNEGVDTNSDGITDSWGSGFVCAEYINIKGKQDMLPPTATISLQGNMVGPGLYAGPVTVTINAVDDMMMGEIHYILDGSESVVSGNKATFKVSTDGTHTIEYWGVDATGNEGSHGTVTFSIDLTPPTVAITAPEPGLYLFGKKLLSMSKPIIIGAFTAEATASDAQGVAVVKFMLDGETIGEDTTVPYSTYVAVKHMGAGTFKVVAEDGVGNTAEDTLDITYYKFL